MFQFYFEILIILKIWKKALKCRNKDETYRWKLKKTQELKKALKHKRWILILFKTVFKDDPDIIEAFKLWKIQREVTKKAILVSGEDDALMREGLKINFFKNKYSYWENLNLVKKESFN